MKKPRHLLLLALLTACITSMAQEPPEDAEKDPAQVEGVEDSTDVATITPVSSDSETDAAREDASAEEDGEPAWVDRGDMASFGKDSRLGPNERANDMATFAGDSIVEGRLSGSMATFLGDAKVMGTVEGDIAVFLGSAELGPEASVRGNVAVFGGELNIHPNAKVYGDQAHFPLWPSQGLESLGKLPPIVRECILKARPIAPSVPFTLFFAGILLLFYLLLALLFAKPTQAGREALQDKPIQAFLIGLLVFACGPAFFVIMAITIIGLALVPFVGLALFAFTIFGKAVVFLYFGNQIARSIKQPILEKAPLSIILGGVIVYILYMIPFFGLFLWFVLSILGLGAVCVATGNSISNRKAADRPQPPASDAAPSPTGESDSGASESLEAKPAETGTSLSEVNAATALSFPRVGFWRRTFATLIDYILMGTFLALVNLALPFITVIAFVYFIVFWGWKGSTLGGMALGIRVQRISGESLDWPLALTRSFSSIVSLLPCFLGFFWAGLDPDKQSWHDKISGSVVVRVPSGYTWI